MCEKDYFEDDLKEYMRRARGHAPGIRRADGRRRLDDAAAAGGECGRRQGIGCQFIKTPDGIVRRLLRASGDGLRGGSARVAGHPGPAARIPAMGKRLAESGYSVLVVNPFYRQKKAPVVPGGCELRGRGHARHGDAARAGAERDDAHERREGVHRMARQPGPGRQEQEDRHDGLLHGRPDRDAHRGRRAGSRRRRRVVPRRRAHDEQSRQPASARPANEGAVPVRGRRERRHARPDLEDHPEGDLREGQAAGRDRGVPRGARLVPARFRGLRQGTGGKGVEPHARAVR